MTMPSERTRAVLQTREFLQWVVTAELTPETLKRLKGEARMLLRHYPNSMQLHLAHLACPVWWGPTLEHNDPMPSDET